MPFFYTVKVLSNKQQIFFYFAGTKTVQCVNKKIESNVYESTRSSLMRVLKD